VTLLSDAADAAGRCRTTDHGDWRLYWPRMDPGTVRLPKRVAGLAPRCSWAPTCFLGLQKRRCYWVVSCPIRSPILPSRNTGSGKFDTPAYACIARTRGPALAALTPGFGAPPVISFWHAFIADWNAGDLTSIVDGSAIPKILMDGPDGVAPPGSGKPDTPCERMHSAKASCAEVLEAPVAAEPLGAVPVPHAARATGRPSKTERPQRLPQRDHPINHHVAKPPRHWGLRTEIRLGARAHATPDTPDTSSTQQLLHHGGLTRPTAQTRNQRSRCGRQTAASAIDAGFVRARAVAGRAAGEWNRRYPRRRSSAGQGTTRRLLCAK
jgi:hypothetical protein